MDAQGTLPDKYFKHWTQGQLLQSKTNTTDRQESCLEDTAALRLLPLQNEAQLSHNCQLIQRQDNNKKSTKYSPFMYLYLLERVKTDHISKAKLLSPHHEKVEIRKRVNRNTSSPNSCKGKNNQVSQGESFSRENDGFFKWQRKYYKQNTTLRGYFNTQENPSCTSLPLAVQETSHPSLALQNIVSLPCGFQAEKRLGKSCHFSKDSAVSLQRNHSRYKLTFWRLIHYLNLFGLP